jgi:DNA (cytosine-5)-methyltransferase 1
VELGGEPFVSTLADLADPDLPPVSAWWQSILRGARVSKAASEPRLRVVDAFCGSGGLALGVKFAAEAIGRELEFAAAVDTDAAALDVYRHNLRPRKAVVESVASLVDFHVKGSDGDVAFAYPPEVISPKMAGVQKVDIFIAGPPCQGHSNLNNHTRRNDPRNDLYVTAVALGVALQSEFILIENVPTVQNSHSDVVATACALLESEGYGVTKAVLKADELGAAQRRARFFILAVKGRSLSSSYLSDTAAEMTAPAMPLSWAIGDLLDRNSDGVMNSTPALNDVNQRRVQYLFDNNLHDLPDSERPDCHKNGTSYTAVYGRMHWDRPSQTITTGFGTPGQGRYIHPLRPRLITPHEAARIQGYPDWFDFDPQSAGVKRKSLTKWIGDAVHPILGYAAGLAGLEAMLCRKAGKIAEAA